MRMSKEDPESHHFRDKLDHHAAGREGRKLEPTVTSGSFSPSGFLLQGEGMLFLFQAK